MSSLLAQIKTEAKPLPSRVFLYAREKFGKSSLFAHAPGVVFFMTRGETGLLELVAGGRVPPTPHFPYDEAAPPTWDTLRQAVRELRDGDHPYKMLVVDTCNGAEILCQEHVLRTQFGNNLSKFSSYGKGWDACRLQWLALVADLDAMRAKRSMGVVLLAHTKIKKYTDPTSEDEYDKFLPACQDKLWELTHKWADVICFGQFAAETYETESGKTRARAVAKRVLCFDQSPQYDAGNRYGLTGRLEIDGGGAKAWAAFAGAVKTARGQARTKPAAPTPPSPDAVHDLCQARSAASGVPLDAVLDALFLHLGTQAAGLDDLAPADLAAAGAWLSPADGGAA